MNQSSQHFKNDLNLLYDQLLEKRRTYVGYPNSQLLENESLAKFLDLTINNVGDPFLGNNGMNTCDFEREVVNFFCESLNLQNGWGYVTNGGTESNLFGMYVARETYPQGIVLFSEETHYSLPKAVRILGMKYGVVNSKPNGEMDYRHFARLVNGLRHYPIIVNLNIGTTMKGAIDDLDKVLAILKSLQVENYYIHCDAALFGGMLPFCESTPMYDFRYPIGSIAISGHKFIGSPIPSGILCVHRHYKEKVTKAVQYIGSNDATISGSRDGFAVLVLWAAINRLGRETLGRLVMECFENADYTISRLKEIGWGGWRNDHSNIVVFRQPSASLVARWQLATQSGVSHVVCMPGVSRSQIDELIEDLRKEMKEKYSDKSQRVLSPVEVAC